MIGSPFMSQSGVSSMSASIIVSLHTMNTDFKAERLLITRSCIFCGNDVGESHDTGRGVAPTRGRSEDRSIENQPRLILHSPERGNRHRKACT